MILCACVCVCVRPSVIKSSEFKSTLSWVQPLLCECKLLFVCKQISSHTLNVSVYDSQCDVWACMHMWVITPQCGVQWVSVYSGGSWSPSMCVLELLIIHKQGRAAVCMCSHKCVDIYFCVRAAKFVSWGGIQAVGKRCVREGVQSLLQIPGIPVFQRQEVTSLNSSARRDRKRKRKMEEGREGRKRRKEWGQSA